MTTWHSLGVVHINCLPTGRIITRLGHINTFFISLMGFCVRLCFYSVITNPWLFIPADLLHGVSFAVIYPCFTSYASAVAPKGAVATTQAIFGATFFVSKSCIIILAETVLMVAKGPKRVESSILTLALSLR